MQNAEKRCALGCVRFSDMCYEGPKKMQSDAPKQNASAEKLDLDAVRVYIREWCGGWDVSDLHQGDCYLIALLAAVDRVLAIPRIEICQQSLTASSRADGHNRALDAVREALGVRD